MKKQLKLHLHYYSANSSESHSVMSDSATSWVQSMEFSRPEYWSGQPFPSPGDLPNPGIEPRSPTLQSDSLPAEPQGKPKNTGLGSLSLLQQIFPSQELNRSLPHCRRILYQLSYEGGLSIRLCKFSDCKYTTSQLHKGRPNETSIKHKPLLLLNQNKNVDN